MNISHARRVVSPGFLNQSFKVCGEGEWDRHKKRAAKEARSVYHLSTKTENSGWKLKWYSSFHRKVSGKDGILRGIPLFPFQPK